MTPDKLSDRSAPSCSLYVALPSGRLLSAEVVDGKFRNDRALLVSSANLYGELHVRILASPGHYQVLVDAGYLPEGLLELPWLGGTQPKCDWCGGSIDGVAEWSGWAADHLLWADCQTIANEQE